MSSKDSGDQWLQNFIPYLMYRASQKLNARLMTRLKATKINPSQWLVLSVLKAYGTLSVSGIVAFSLMEQPTVSRVVAQLEKDGLVSRAQATGDSRIREVTLTANGCRVFESIYPAAFRHQELALQGISRKEIKMFSDILSRIEHNIEI